jgi:hypothetical protein
MTHLLVQIGQVTVFRFLAVVKCPHVVFPFRREVRVWVLWRLEVSSGDLGVEPIEEQFGKKFLRCGNIRIFGSFGTENY